MTDLIAGTLSLIGILFAGWYVVRLLFGLLGFIFEAGDPE